MIESIKQRFWKKVSRKESDECWNWIAGTNGKGGYGRFRISNNQVDYAHRVSYKFANNCELNSEDVIMHSCDNRICCNPIHLSKGTPADNIKDMMMKGRNTPVRGQDHYNSKLKETDVIKIRMSNDTNTKLAHYYGVKQHTISNVRTGVTWRHM